MQAFSDTIRAARKGVTSTDPSLTKSPVSEVIMAKTSLPNNFSIDNLEVAPKPKNPRFKDEEGKRFDRLLVLGFYGRWKRDAAWWCLCDCGELTITWGFSLRSGSTKSCGCKRFKIVLPEPPVKRDACGFPDCSRKASTRGYCPGHLARLYRTGTLQVGRPRLEGEAVRFWRRVALTADVNRCWLWTGDVSTNNGYGRCYFKGKAQVTHRIAWEIVHGKPAEQLLLHSCDTPACVNPNHLREGTQRENTQDAIARQRFPWQHRTHCKYGHALVGDNRMTVPRSSGTTSLVCRQCHREAGKRYRARRRAR